MYDDGPGGVAKNESWTLDEYKVEILAAGGNRFSDKTEKKGKLSPKNWNGSCILVTGK